MVEPGRFVAVASGGEWHEVFLGAGLPQGDGRLWLCYTTHHEFARNFTWVAVELSEAGVICASSIGKARSYPGLTDEQVNWTCEGKCGRELWCPGPAKRKAIVDHAVRTCQQLGNIPVPAVVAAGGPSQILPSLIGYLPPPTPEAGSFYVLFLGGTWQEVFLVRATQSDGKHWLARTTTCACTPMWSLVRLEPGYFLKANADRSYPILMEDDVWWMVTENNEAYVPWVPSDLKAIDQEANALLAGIGIIPEEAYCIAGQQEPWLRHCHDVNREIVLPEAGKFAAVMYDGHWQEVFLCVQLGDASNWLCLTWATAKNTFYWCALHLVEGQCLIFKNRGSNRVDVDIDVRQLRQPPTFEEVWVPGPVQVQSALKDAEIVLQQLGDIPPQFYVWAGSVVEDDDESRHLPDIVEVGMKLLQGQ
ncbi:unnamed protein product [Symbiodinium pilosum]|uniref:Uncharacterized protein n=1 Tax=Symbiodinium pilosum TaxID=2952 RepID=A0A812X0Q4_SYMPI|nr:unnamed protein product [Symbiodinium pilosum]